MTPPPWHATHTALTEYAFKTRWVRSVGEAEHNAALLARARSEIEKIASAATFRARDRYGRELWRSSKRTGAWRMVIDARQPAGRLPDVIWIGQGAPPARVWAPST